MQRTHVSKRLTALLLTLVMLLGIIPTAWANPEGPQPMEIHGWGLQEQDHELIAQQQDLHFEFQGIPTEGYAFLASEFSLTLEYYGWDPQIGEDVNVHTETLPAKSLEPIGHEQYVATFEIDGTHPNTQLRIMGVSIGDGSGNPWVVNEWISTCNIGDAYSTDMAVTGMSVDQSAVTLTDANYDAVNDVFHPETVTLTMDLSLPAGFTIPVDGNNNPEYEIEFSIENDNTEKPTNHSIGGTVLKTDANGTIYAECEMGVDFFWGEGTYHIEWVKYRETGKDTVYLPLNGSNIALKVVHNQTDKTAPVITDAYYTLNGQRQTEGGFRVEPTDTLTFHIATTDTSKIMDNTTGLMSEYYGETNVNAVYDTTVGELIVTLPVDQMAATEWYMNYFHSVDPYENLTAWQLGDEADFDAMKNLYFYLYDANGNCDIPTRTVVVRFYSMSDPMPEFELRDCPRVFDLSDALGANMPTASVPENRTFVGWYSESNNRPTYTTADDTVVMMDGQGDVNLFPAYDQAVFYVHYCYINSKQEIQHESIDVTLPYGKTLGDAVDAAAAALAQLDHDAGAQFVEWTCENNLDQVIDPTFIGFEIAPVYAKLPVTVEYNYMKQSGIMGEPEVKVIYVTPNSTIAQLEQQLMTDLAGLPHYSDLTLQSWNVDYEDQIQISMQFLQENGGFMVALPQYDKTFVTVNYGYIDEKGESQSVEMPLLLPSGATVQDAIDAAVDLSALKHYGKINLVDWEIDPPTSFPADTQPHITVNPVYDKVPVNVNYRYLQADGTYEWTEVEVLVTPGSTVADAMDAAGLNNLTHFTGLTMLGWNVQGPQLTEEIHWAFGGFSVDAIYDKIPVSVSYGYWDENGEAQVGITALLVNNGAIYQDVVDAFYAYAAGLKHWDDAGFDRWYDITGMDPNMPVGPGFEIGFMAGYDMALPSAYGEDTAVVIGYYDKNLIYREYTVEYDDTKDLTYREMVNEGIATVANAHNGQLTLQEWDFMNYDGELLDDSFLDKKAQSENVVLFAYADYTDLVVDVWYSYRNADGDIVDDMTSVVVPRTATYQDVVNKAQLPTDHSTVCGFVEWNFMGLDLTEKVEGSSRHMDAIATYEKYPVTYRYTYLGANSDNDGETFHVTQTKMLDAGTNVMAFFDGLTGVAHYSNLTFNRWVLTKRNFNAVGEVNLWTNEVAVMAEYSEGTPFCIEIGQLNDDLALEVSEHILYVEGTVNEAPIEDLLMVAKDQLEDMLDEILTIPSGFKPISNGEMFEEYIPMGNNYFSGMYLYLDIIYDKAVLDMCNPDGTITKVVVNNGEQYTLPTTYNGKAVEWHGPEVYQGKVTVWSPITEAHSEYVICYHSMTKTAAKAASCTADGNIEYYTCSKCEGIFADEAGEKELTAAELVVKAAGHKMTHTPAKEATYTENGNKEFYYCEVCQALFADADGKTAITAADVIIPQLIKVEDTKAEVSEGAMDTAIEEAIKAVSDEVTLDLTHKEVIGEDQKEAVTEAELPVAALESVAKEDKSLTLVKEDATVTLDTKALEAIAEQAEGESVTLKVQSVEVTTLKPAQQSAVKSKKVALTISAELICNKTGENIATQDGKGFGGGAATVAVPVPEQLPEGIKAADLKVFYVADDGKVTPVNSKLVDGKIVFELKHFSEYVIAADAPAAPAAPATGDSFPVMLVTMALLVSAAGIVILSRKTKRA